VELTKLSLADLETLETNIYGKYYEVFPQSLKGDEKAIAVRDTMATKLTEVRNEINRRVDEFINQ